MGSASTMLTTSKRETVYRLTHEAPASWELFMSKYLIGLAFAFAACGSRLPRPSYTEQPSSALVEVDYPPPPARVEFVPARPKPNAVWLNGEWIWAGRRWAWRPGGWVVPPPEAAFARMVVVRRSDGRLFAAAGTWRNARGAEVPAPEFEKISPSSSSAVVNSEGEVEPTAADIHADAGRDAESD
jgi:hypothetical protein